MKEYKRIVLYVTPEEWEYLRNVIKGDDSWVKALIGDELAYFHAYREKVNKE